MKRDYTNRLEKALEAYEDSLWCLHQVWESEGRDTSRLLPPMSLREKLSRGEPTNEVFDALLDSSAQEKDRNRDGLIQLLLDTAVDVADWAQTSRRIFSVSKSLTEMLMETDLPEFKAGEVKFVSPVFAVALEEPIVTSPGKIHDFLVFINLPMEEDDQAVMISIRSYTPSLDNYHRISDKERGKVEEMRYTSPRQFRRYLPKIIREFSKVGCIGFSYVCPEGFPYNSLLGAEGVGESVATEDREVLFKIAFGLNLYLQSARKGDQETRVVNRPKRSERGRSVMDGAELFELNVSSAFSRSGPSEHEIHSGFEVRPHFRRGHWRRPKGFGQDPDAPATEWVRPTWVHKDRIDQGIQPVGSLQLTR